VCGEQLIEGLLLRWLCCVPAGTPLMGSTSVDANIASLASSAWLNLDGLAWAARGDSRPAAAPTTTPAAAAAGNGSASTSTSSTSTSTSSLPSSSELESLVTFCSEDRTQRCLARFYAQQGSDVWPVAPSLAACAVFTGGQAAEWLQQDSRWAACRGHAAMPAPCDRVRMRMPSSRRSQVALHPAMLCAAPVCMTYVQHLFA
jgi:hypothetical protein